MSTLRISDAPLLPNVNGTEKIPTGGRGDYAVSIDQLKTFTQGGLPKQIEDHIEDISNPHNVTKEQVGLGNVDNIADIDKPISTATQSALNTKADKATTLVGYNIKDAYTKAQVDTAISSVAGGGYGYATLAEAQTAATTLPIPPNSIVTITNDPMVSNNGTYQWNGTTLTKSAYDPLVLSKNYTDGEIDSLDEKKLDKYIITEPNKFFVFADDLGNVVGYYDINGNLISKEFINHDGLSLGTLKESIDSLPYSIVALGETAIGFVDDLGNVFARVDVSGDVFLPKLDRPLHEEISRINNVKNFSINFSIAAPNLNNDAVGRIKNLQNISDSQNSAITSRKRVSTYKDGNTTIQRIPVLFQVEPNKVLCMFNRGIVGFDGDLRGVDTYQCFIEFNDKYQITNISTPTLMYSVQDELVGGSAKHATICRRPTGDLYVMFDVRTENLPHAYYEQRFMTSSDNGVTWSTAQPVVYNNTFLTPAEIDSNISFVMGSCGQIIVLPSGRLVTPMYTTTEALRRAFIIYSDDNGLTWNVSNWIGGSLGQGGDGVSLGEPNIVRLNSGRLLIYMKSIAPIISYKVKAYSDDDGETIVLVGNTNIRGSNCMSAITKFADDTLIMTNPISEVFRTDFRATFSVDEGENFNLFQHQELRKDVYGGYSSVIPLNDEAIMVAVEGITAIELGGGESIDVYTVNIKEVMENGISY